MLKYSHENTQIAYQRQTHQGADSVSIRSEFRLELCKRSLFQAFATDWKILLRIRHCCLYQRSKPIRFEFAQQVHTTQLALIDYSLVNSTKDTEFFENMYFHFNNGEVLQYNKQLGKEWFGCPFLSDQIRIMIKSRLS